MSDAYEPEEVYRSIPFTKGQWRVLTELAPKPGKVSRLVQSIVWEYIKNYPMKEKKNEQTLQRRNP